MNLFRIVSTFPLALLGYILALYIFGFVQKSFDGETLAESSTVKIVIILMVMKYVASFSYYLIALFFLPRKISGNGEAYLYLGLFTVLTLYIIITSSGFLPVFISVLMNIIALYKFGKASITAHFINRGN